MASRAPGGDILISSEHLYKSVHIELLQSYLHLKVKYQETQLGRFKDDIYVKHFHHFWV